MKTGYLIEGSNFNMLSLFLGTLIVLSSCSVNKQSGQMQNEIFLQIDFQDFFKGEQVSFKFNGCTVFDKIKLYSNSSTGLTKVQVKILKEQKDNYFILFLDKSINCKSKDTYLELMIAING